MRHPRVRCASRKFWRRSTAHGSPRASCCTCSRTISISMATIRSSSRTRTKPSISRSTSRKKHIRTICGACGGSCWTSTQPTRRSLVSRGPASPTSMRTDFGYEPTGGTDPLRELGEHFFPGDACSRTGFPSARRHVSTVPRWPPPSPACGTSRTRDRSSTTRQRKELRHVAAAPRRRRALQAQRDRAIDGCRAKGGAAAVLRAARRARAVFVPVPQPRRSGTRAHRRGGREQALGVLPPCVRGHSRAARTLSRNISPAMWATRRTTPPRKRISPC